MKPRWPFVAVAILSAALFAISAWVGQWWLVGEVTIGPIGSHHCFGGDCRPAGLAWINAGDFWQRMGVATFVGSLVSMMGLLAVAGSIAASRAPTKVEIAIRTLASKSTLVALASTTIAGTYFIVKMPAITGLETGQGLYLFIAALVVGVVAPIRVLRRA